MDAAKRHGFQTVHVKRNHEQASKEGYEYAEKTLKKLRKCKTCQYRDWPREDLDGCTENNMPMSGVFWCIKYHGVVQPPDQEKPPCGIDDWSTCDFTMFDHLKINKTGPWWTRRKAQCGLDPSESE